MAESGLNTDLRSVKKVLLWTPLKKVFVAQACVRDHVTDDPRVAAGGGDVKIESHKMNFREKAQSKVGSLDNVSHSPGGGNITVRSAHTQILFSTSCKPFALYSPV